jgi:hypothetical protein
MITRAQINLGEYLSTSHKIKQILNAGQWILVLAAAKETTMALS